MPAELRPIFKAYDVRGLYPEEFDEDAAYRIGRAFAGWVAADRVVLGRDCRLSSPALAEAFTRGVTAEGVGVVDIGLATTDMVYFGSGRMSLPGAMFTASHNPPRYNGLKLCRERAAPIGEASGLEEIRELAEGEHPSPAGPSGSVDRHDLVEEYLEHLLTFIDLDSLAPLTVVADAANGMAGLVVPAMFERLPGAKLVPLFMELDGAFPNHPADPIDPRNQEDLRGAVTEHGADIGLAFDGDADRPGGKGDARAGAGGHDPAQHHHLVGGAGGHPGARGHGRPDPGRALLHQGGDGRDRSRVRG